YNNIFVLGSGDPGIGATGNNMLAIGADMQPLTQNGWFVGTNSEAIYGSALNGGETLFSMRDTGPPSEPDFNFLQIGIATNGASTSWITLQTQSGEVEQDWHSPASSWFLKTTEMELSGTQLGGNGAVDIFPGAPDGTPIFKVNSSVAHTSGNLLEVANDTTNW